MLPIRLTPEAECEYQAAIRWFERNRKGRGKRFSAAVREVFHSIQIAPDRWPFEIDNVRHAVVSGFSYSIFYRVEPGMIEVVSVFHQHRDPQEWLDRI